MQVKCLERGQLAGENNALPRNREIAIHLQSTASRSRVIAADILETSIYIRASVADRREIAINWLEIATYIREIAADIQEMAVNIVEMTIYSRRTGTPSRDFNCNAQVSQRGDGLRAVSWFATVSLRARPMIFSRSTSRAKDIRTKVSKVGFRNPFSTNLTACQDSPAFCATTFRERPRCSRSALSRRATWEQMASEILSGGTPKRPSHTKEQRDRRSYTCTIPAQFLRAKAAGTKIESEDGAVSMDAKRKL